MTCVCVVGLVWAQYFGFAIIVDVGGALYTFVCYLALPLPFL